jgi:hypothetical protein
MPEREECTTVTNCVEDPENPGVPICEDVTTCVIVPEQPAIEAVPGYTLLNAFAYSRQFPANATRVESSLANDLNRAAALNASVQREAFGPIPPEPDQDPKLEIASCILYNVQSWRVAGHVGSFSFDVVVPAGTYAKYENGTLVHSTPIPESRTYLSTGLYLEFYSGDPIDDYATVSIALGRAFPLMSNTGDDVAPLEVLHQSPSSFVHNPKINIEIAATNLATSVRIASARSDPGYTAGADGNASICGRVLKMTFVDAIEVLTDYSLEITPETYWGSDEWHHL